MAVPAKDGAKPQGQSDVILARAITARSFQGFRQTEYNPELLEFPAVDGRRVVAAFEGGAITSDAGALLLARQPGRSV